MTGTFKADAGMTILELIVALGIVAGLAAVLSASIRPRQPSEDDSSKHRSAVLIQARTKAILTGSPQIVAEASSEMNQLAPAERSEQSMTVEAAGKVVFYPDGTSWPANAFSVRSSGQ